MPRLNWRTFTITVSISDSSIDKYPENAEIKTGWIETPHHKSKIAAKIDKKNMKNRSEGKKNTSDFGQSSAPFHEGILPSQYNAQESALEKVGRVKRRTEW